MYSALESCRLLYGLRAIGCQSVKGDTIRGEGGGGGEGGGKGSGVVWGLGLSGFRVSGLGTLRFEAARVFVGFTVCNLSFRAFSIPDTPSI